MKTPSEICQLIAAFDESPAGQCGWLSREESRRLQAIWPAGTPAPATLSDEDREFLLGLLRNEGLLREEAPRQRRERLRRDGRG